MCSLYILCLCANMPEVNSAFSTVSEGLLLFDFGGVSVLYFYCLLSRDDNVVRMWVQLKR